MIALGRPMNLVRGTPRLPVRTRLKRDVRNQFRDDPIPEIVKSARDLKIGNRPRERRDPSRCSQGRTGPNVGRRSCGASGWEEIGLSSLPSLTSAFMMGEQKTQVFALRQGARTPVFKARTRPLDQFLGNSCDTAFSRRPSPPFSCPLPARLQVLAEEPAAEATGEAVLTGFEQGQKDGRFEAVLTFKGHPRSRVILLRNPDRVALDLFDTVSAPRSRRRPTPPRSATCARASSPPIASASSGR